MKESPAFIKENLAVSVHVVLVCACVWGGWGVRIVILGISDKIA